MELLIEISQERFFKDVEELDDVGYWQLQASERREESDKDGGGDFVLGIDEVKSWPNCRFFAAIPKNSTHINHLYVIRPVDEQSVEETHGETKWYHFAGGSWAMELEKGEKYTYPSQVSCTLYGNHLRVRYVNVNEGSGFDAEYPFEDLVKVFSHLRDIYRALGKSDVKMRQLEVRVKTESYGNEHFVDREGNKVEVANDTTATYMGQLLNVRYVPRHSGAGHGEPAYDYTGIVFVDPNTGKRKELYEYVTINQLVDTGRRG